MFHKLKRIYRSIRYFRLYVIADPNDNSMTFSRKLYRHIVRNCPNASSDDKKNSEKVLVFRVPEHKCFGFMVNPTVEQETQMADIMYNAKYHTIGFESLCPSVNRILYEYNLPSAISVSSHPSGAVVSPSALRLSVTPARTSCGKIYYRIEKP